MTGGHGACVDWQLGAHDFTGKRYSRAHTWRFDGGAVVPASSSPHVVPLPWSDASAVDPEEAFVAALSSCHMLWFLDFAARAGFVVERYVDAAEGHMGRDERGKAAITLVVLRPRTRFAPGRAPDAPTLAHLHHRAHEACFLANSVRSEIRCEPAFD